jgi:hypothetical protein
MPKRLVAPRWKSTGLLLCLAVWLSACAEPPPAAPDCSASAHWRAGLERRLPDLACTEPDAKQAHLLGTELAGLRAEFDDLDQQLKAADPQGAGALSRRQRQLQVDIEAIEAEARVQGWQ